MRKRGIVAAAVVVALAAVVVYRSGADRTLDPPPREERGADRVEPAVPARGPAPVAKAPELVAWRFVLRPDPGLDVGEAIRVLFDQKLTGRRVVGVFRPDRPESVELHPDEVWISLENGPAGLVVWPRRAELSGAPRDRPLELRLCGAGDLVLEARDGSDDSPVAGVALAVEAAGAGEVNEKRATGDDGSVRFPGLPVGPYRVRIRDRAYTADPSGRTFVDPEFDVRVDAGVERAERIVLHRYDPPVCEVEVRIAVDGAPADPARIRALRLAWRGTDWTLERAEDEPGLYRARGRPLARGERTETPSALFVAAEGCEDHRQEIPIGTAADERLALRADLVRFRGRARGRLSDPSGAPIPGRVFRVALHHDGNRAAEIREVRTDDHGEFAIEHVRFPLSFFAVNETPGERITPSDVNRGRVPEGRELVFVRYARRETEVAAGDPAEMARVLDESRGVAFVDVLPVAAVNTRIRPVWGDGERLARSAAARLRETGRLPLGDLPDGDYRLWLFFPTRGALNLDVPVGRRDASADPAAAFESVREDLRGRLVADRVTAAGYAVFDGYVPHYLGASLLLEQERLIGGLGARDARASARTDEEGAFVLGAHNAKNPWLTAIAPDATVFHLPKSSLRGGGVVALVDHPEDLVVTGRLVDPRGEPVAGLNVSLGPVKGADARVRFQVPDPNTVNPVPTGPDGRFRIRGVRPGAYYLSVARVTMEGTVRHVDVITDMNRIVDVTGLDRDGLELVVPDPREEADHDHGR